MPLPVDKAPKDFIGAVEDAWQLYSDNAQDYTVGSPIGFGASSIVYAATFHPPKSPSPPTPCAVKVLDLDSLPPSALHLLRRETQLMSLSKHPNVLRVRGSWIDGHHLCIALRLMNAGSAADVMRYAWPGGMEEEVVKCVLKQALEGLNYLHINGFIHRDIKAANLLIDEDGTVLLADLGVAADLLDDNTGRDVDPHHRRIVNFDPAPTVSATTARSPVMAPPSLKVVKRKSFVGTPCWMAPEVIGQKQYDFSADIWSFGITAIELTQGRPPRSRETAQKVLLQTVKEAPPVVSRTGGDGTTKLSRAFQEIVESCLEKDPSKRPTAAQLLQTPFFKNVKKKSHLVGTILRGLPPLVQRQERRRVPVHSTRTSVDSWDFTLTHTASPTSTHFRRPPSFSPLEVEIDFADVHSRRSRGRSEDSADHRSVRSAARSLWSRSAGGSRNHSRAVSWAEEDGMLFPADVPVSAQPISEAVEAAVASPPLSDEECVSDADAEADEDHADEERDGVGLAIASSGITAPHEHGAAAGMPGLSSSPYSGHSPHSSLSTPSTTPTFVTLAKPSPDRPPLPPSVARSIARASLAGGDAPPGPVAGAMAVTPPSDSQAQSGLWRKFRSGRPPNDRRLSSSSDKEKKRVSISGFLTRTISGGGGSSAPSGGSATQGSSMAGSMRAKLGRTISGR